MKALFSCAALAVALLSFPAAARVDAAPHIKVSCLKFSVKDITVGRRGLRRAHGPAVVVSGILINDFCGAFPHLFRPVITAQVGGTKTQSTILPNIGIGKSASWAVSGPLTYAGATTSLSITVTTQPASKVVWTLQPKRGVATAIDQLRYNGGSYNMDTGDITIN